MWRGCSLLGGGGVGLRWVAWCFAGGMQRPAGCAVAWGDAFARRAGGALPPRCLRCSRSPGARGCAPLPPAPHPRQAELAGFCALSRACCASRRVFLCSRTEPPACVVLAHAATRRVRAGGALPPRRSRCSRSPRARGCAPLPPDPHPRQAELAGFCALRARAALRAGGFVLAHGATRRVCAGACSHHPPVCAQSQLRQSLPPTLSHCSKASLSCSE